MKILEFKYCRDGLRWSQSRLEGRKRAIEDAGDESRCKLIKVGEQVVTHKPWGADLSN